MMGVGMGVNMMQNVGFRISINILVMLILSSGVISDSDSNSEPRYLDQFSLKFGTPSPKLKRQSQDDLEVSSIIGDLLREQEDTQFDSKVFAEERTFPGEDLFRKGAKDLSDDIHAILSDILDGAEEEEEEQDLNSLRQELSLEEQRILESLRDLEEEEQREASRKPIRFRDSQDSSTRAIFSSSFGEQGLRTEEERQGNQNVPNLSNRGRFNPSAPRMDPLAIGNSAQRGGRQRATCKYSLSFLINII